MFQRSKKKISSVRVASIGAAVAQALENRLLLAAHIVGDPTVYPTIQAAVDAAAAGATITVDPGNYPEQVVVSEPLTIEGAQAGVDARLTSRLNGTSSTESIVTGATRSSGQSSGFYIDANDVTIDGFTVEGETNQSDNYGAGIVIGAYQYGTHVINNVVQNNVSGLFLANNSTTDPALIQYNAFLNNNNAGENGGRGIYTDETLSGGSLTDVSIDSNLFSGNFGGEYTTNLEAAVALEANISGAQSNIAITNNDFTDNGKALLAFNATNIVFDGNTVTGCQDQESGSIRFEGNVQNVTIDGNNVSNNWGPGVAVDSKGASGDNSGFVVNGNDFVMNNAAYGTPISVVYAANAYTGAFNALNNWWDSVSGPSGDGSGSGDAVSAGTFQQGTGLGWALAPGGDTIYSPWSTTSNLTSMIPPTAPTGLTAVPTSGTQVQLQWTDTAAGTEYGFIIQRSVDGTTFTQVGTTNASTTSFSDPSAAAGTAYTYRVYSTSAAGNSDYSNVATVTTPVPPSAPTHLTAVAASGTMVKLAWTDTAAKTETGFIIQRSIAGSAYVQVATVPRGVTTYTDATASGATSYSYLVEATSAVGNSASSNVATVKTPAVATAPTALIATERSSTQIGLTWIDTAVGIETGFVIERSSAGKTLTKIGATGKGITTFVDTSASINVAYTYEIYATSAGGNSPLSAPATITIYPVATAPTGLKAAATSATQVNLSWIDSSPGIETGFVIQRSFNGSTFTTINTTAAHVTTYVDKTTVANATYEYRIYALSAGGNSAYSLVVKVTTPA